MSEKKPMIQIWITECPTKEMQDVIVERCKHLPDCTNLFTGVDHDGNYVVIKLLTGSTTITPSIELRGFEPYPDGPRTRPLARLSVDVTAEIKHLK